jgi:hypothetical protein
MLGRCVHKIYSLNTEHRINTVKTSQACNWDKEESNGNYYSSTLSLSSALDGGGWSTPRPGCFAPEKDFVPIVQEAR